MRTQLIAAITTATTSAYTNAGFRVSSQQPFEQGGNPLYLKNLKTVYVGADETEETVLIPVVRGSEVFRVDIICEAYLAVDAKNPPALLDAYVTAILGTKANTGITNFGVESDYTVETQEDVLIYTFEFRMNTITY